MDYILLIAGIYWISVIGITYYVRHKNSKKNINPFSEKETVTGCAGQKDRRKMGQGVLVERDSQSPEGGVQESVWHHTCGRPIYPQKWR